jgi:hypothetical protein
MGMTYSYDRRNPEPTWKERAHYHEREIQGIKRILKQNSLRGQIFDEYGEDRLNKLRKSLELHRIALGAAQNGRDPTKEELRAGIQHLPPAVRDAKV